MSKKKYSTDKGDSLFDSMENIKKMVEDIIEVDNKIKKISKPKIEVEIGNLSDLENFNNEMEDSVEKFQKLKKAFSDNKITKNYSRYIKDVSNSIKGMNDNLKKYKEALSDNEKKRYAREVTKYYNGFKALGGADSEIPNFRKFKKAINEINKELEQKGNWKFGVENFEFAIKLTNQLKDLEKLTSQTSEKIEQDIKEVGEEAEKISKKTIKKSEEVSKKITNNSKKTKKGIKQDVKEIENVVDSSNEKLSKKIENPSKKIDETIAKSQKARKKSIKESETEVEKSSKNISKNLDDENKKLDKIIEKNKNIIKEKSKKTKETVKTEVEDEIKSGSKTSKNDKFELNFAYELDDEILSRVVKNIKRKIEDIFLEMKSKVANETENIDYDSNLAKLYESVRLKKLLKKYNGDDVEFDNKLKNILGEVGVTENELKRSLLSNEGEKSRKSLEKKARRDAEKRFSISKGVIEDDIELFKLWNDDFKRTFSLYNKSSDSPEKQYAFLLQAKRKLENGSDYIDSYGEEISDFIKNLDKNIEKFESKIPKDKVKAIKDNGIFRALSEYDSIFYKKLKEQTSPKLPQNEILSQTGLISDGDFSYREKTSEGQIAFKSMKLDEEGWKETSNILNTSFENVEKEILKLDKQIERNKSSRRMLYEKYGEIYDSLSLDKVTLSMESKRNDLLSSLQHFSNDDEYAYDISDFEKKRSEILSDIRNEENNKENINRAKETKKREQANQKEIEKTNAFVSKSQMKFDNMVSSYSSILPKLSADSIEKLNEHRSILEEELMAMKNTISSSADKQYIEEFLNSFKNLIKSEKELIALQEKQQKQVQQTSSYISKKDSLLNSLRLQYDSDKNKGLSTPVKVESDKNELRSSEEAIRKLLESKKGKTISSEEKDEIEKLISAYKDLIKVKIKANNPTKKEMGGQDLEFAIKNEIYNIDTLIQKIKEYDNSLDLIGKLENQRNILTSPNADAEKMYNAQLERKLTNVEFNSIVEAHKEEEQEIKDVIKLYEQAIKKAEEYATLKLKKNVSDTSKNGIFSGSDVANLEKLELKLKELKTRKDGIVNSQGIYTPNEIEKVNKISILLGEVQKDAENIANIKLFENSKSDLSDMANKLQGMLDKGGMSSSSFSKIKSTLEDVNGIISDFKDKKIVDNSEIATIYSNLEKVKEVIKEVNREGNQDALLKIGQKTEKVLRENSAMSSELRQQFVKLSRDVSLFTSGMKELNNQDISKLRGELNSLIYDLEKSGKTGLNFTQNIMKRAKQMTTNFIGMYFSGYDLFNYSRQAFGVLQELDESLIDLRKTSKMSAEEMDAFYFSANDVAKELGITTNEVITQASAWSRLGYNTAEASEEMAKLSSQFAMISPSMSTDLAQEGLVSIMKAYQIDPKDVKEQIMNPINQLGNNFAESNVDIVEGMEKASASLAATGTSFNDSVALFTGGMEVLQNAEKMGTALRSISMRVRGYNEETEELDNSLTNITGEVYDLTKTAQHSEGISLFTDETQEHYKSLVDYLRELSERWDEISEKNRQALLQKLFAKTQAQAGAAIITNFEQVDNALQSIEESGGSADREMSVVQDSITYKLNKLKETYTGLLMDIGNRDVIKEVVDGFTSFATIIDKFPLSSLTSIITLIGQMKGYNLVDFSLGKNGKINTKIFGSEFGNIKSGLENQKRSLSENLSRWWNGYDDSPFKMDDNKLNGYLTNINSIISGKGKKDFSQFGELSGTFKNIAENADGTTLSLEELQSQLSDAARQAIESGASFGQIGAKSQFASIGVKVLSAAVNVLAGALIGMAINAAIEGLSSLAHYSEQLGENYKNSINGLTEQIGKINELNSELDQNNEKLKTNTQRLSTLQSLYSNGTITTAQAKELAELQEQHAELEKDIAQLKSDMSTELEKAHSKYNELSKKGVQSYSQELYMEKQLQGNLLNKIPILKDLNSLYFQARSYIAEISPALDKIFLLVTSGFNFYSWADAVGNIFDKIKDVLNNIPVVGDKIKGITDSGSSTPLENLNAAIESRDKKKATSYYQDYIKPQLENLESLKKLGKLTKEEEKEYNKLIKARDNFNKFMYEKTGKQSYFDALQIEGKKKVIKGELSGEDDGGSGGDIIPSSEETKKEKSKIKTDFKKEFNFEKEFEKNFKEEFEKKDNSKDVQIAFEKYIDSLTENADMKEVEKNLNGYKLKIRNLIDNFGADVVNSLSGETISSLINNDLLFVDEMKPKMKKDLATLFEEVENDDDMTLKLQTVANGTMALEDIDSLINTILELEGFDKNSPLILWLKEQKLSEDNIFNKAQGNFGTEDKTRKGQIKRFVEEYNPTVKELETLKIKYGNDSKSNVQDIIDDLREIRSEHKITQDSLTNWSESDEAEEGEDLSERQKLLELAKAGELTKKAFNKSSAKESFLKTFGYDSTEVEDAISDINKLYEASKQLSTLETKVGVIDSVSEDRNEDSSKKVKSSTFASAYDTAGVENWSKKNKKVWENYKDVMSDSASTSKEVKKAQDDLTTSIINEGNYLDSLTKTNQKNINSQLKSMGITNANDITTASLVETQQLQKVNGEKVSNITDELSRIIQKNTDKTGINKKAVEQESSALFKEKGISENTANALWSLTQEKILAKDTQLNEIGTINALIRVREEAGLATTALENYKIAKQNYDNAKSSAKKFKDQDHSGMPSSVENKIQEQKDKEVEKQKEKSENAKTKATKEVKSTKTTKTGKKKTTSSKSTNNGGSGSSSNYSNESSPSSSYTPSSSDTSTKKSKVVIDWLERRVTTLSNSITFIESKIANIFGVNDKASDKRIKQINEEIKKENSLIKTYKKQESVYGKTKVKTIASGKAYTDDSGNKVGKGKKLSKNIIKKIKNGSIKGNLKQLIATYGENQGQRINDYISYYDKSQTAKNNRIQSETKIKELKIQKKQEKLDVVNAKLDSKSAKYESMRVDALKNRNSNLDARIKLSNESYNKQIEIAKLQNNTYEAEKLEAERLSAERELKIQKSQNKLDDANARIERNEATSEVEDFTAEKKNKRIDTRIGQVEEMYQYEIDIAKLEGDSVKVDTLKAKKQKDILDLKIQQHQNTIDESEAISNNYQLEEDMLFISKDKNALEEKSREEIIKQYDEQYEIARLQNDVNAQKKVQLEKEQAIAESIQKEFDNIKEYYGVLLDVIDAQESLKQGWVEYNNSRGYVATASDYENLIKKEQEKVETATEQLNVLANKSTIGLTDEQITQHFIDIDKLEAEILGYKTNIENYEKEILETMLRPFEYLEKVYSEIGEHLEYQQTILSSFDKVLSKDGLGGLTTEGLSSLSVSLDQIALNEDRIKNKYKEIEKLNENFELGNFTAEEYLEKFTELSSEVRNFNTEISNLKDTIKSLVKEALDTMKSALDENISKYKESLQKAKDLYDYQKNISKQLKNISTLEKQINALSGGNSEETRAKIQQLSVDLDNAKEELQETEYDRYIQDQEEILDNMSEDFQDFIDGVIGSNVDVLIQAVKSATNENASAITNKLDELNIGQIEKVTVNGDNSTEVDLTDYNGGGTTLSADSDTNITGVETSSSDGTTNSVSQEKIVEEPLWSESTDTSETDNTNKEEETVVNTNAKKTDSDNNTTAKTEKIIDAITVDTIVSKKFPAIAKILNKLSNGKPSKDKLEYDNLAKRVYNKFGKKGLSYTQEANIGNALEGKAEYIPADFNPSVKGNSKKKVSKITEKIRKKLIKAGFSQGGVVDQAIKKNNDDVLITAKVGERILKPVDSENFEKFNSILPDVVQTMDMFKESTFVPSARNVNSNINNTVNITLDGSNVFDSKTFIKELQSPAMTKAVTECVSNQLNKSYNNVLSKF